jgi:hypothetical protein
LAKQVVLEKGRYRETRGASHDFPSIIANEKGFRECERRYREVDAFQPERHLSHEEGEDQGNDDRRGEFEGDVRPCKFADDAEAYAPSPKKDAWPRKPAPSCQDTQPDGQDD